MTEVSTSGHFLGTSLCAATNGALGMVLLRSLNKTHMLMGKGEFERAERGQHNRGQVAFFQQTGDRELM
jgi:hypothetical protein